MTHLRVENIDFEGRSVRVRGKFNKTRIAFLTPSASAALRAYIQYCESGYVFQEDRKQQHAGISATDGYWVARWVDYGQPVSLRKIQTTMDESWEDRFRVA